ncbi:hypothetical protein ACJIZ3_005543 [Penstemon smallii]|uniref:Uncharacterized protein n=1 Tax=Penstemon smallii TaxID=265156 RepID=A0ABD3S571_9LAMI
MGIDLLNFGVKIRKVAIFTIRVFNRSVYNHPFLVGMLCFLIFMYRTFPLFFSILVSASPVLICTAVLLGTLLSFGQPNIPEIEIEDKTSHEVVSLKTRVSENATIVEQNESFYVDRFSEKRGDGLQHSNEQPSLSDVHEDDIAPLIEERTRKIELENGEMLDDMKYKKKGEWNDEMRSDGEVMENLSQYASIPRVDDENLDSDDEKSEADSFDSERVNVDSLDSPPRSPWKRVEDREEQEQQEEDEDDLDSGSDGAESSSPDASMADILPMLDELHPLLDEDAPQPAHLSANGSDVESERSLKSSISSHESDNEIENHEDLEVAEDDNEDKTKSAITWTEEDQKNLMDLGSSEIERNQRLENLILRRRARKNMSMVPERNLIDLESFDLPFNIAPISTSRQNPFDMPHDTSGLPPIPGSAPSILLQRRNPFDIPYDSSEEKPDLVGGELHEDFTTLPSRETVFRRHESFNVRPSVFAPNRQDVKYRPFFVPERIDSDESTSYSPFQRQSSELSDSKVSSIGSVEDPEDREIVDVDNRPELKEISNMKRVTKESLSVDPELIKEEVIKEDVQQEPKLISERDHVSDVGHGSQSSEEEEEEGEEEEEESLENQVQAIGNHSNSEAVEQRYSRDSSSSSLSEESERVFIENEEGSIILEERREVNAEEPIISTEASVETNNLIVPSAVIDDDPHGEPVYDSSPLDAESDLVLPPIFVKRESEGSSQEMDKDMLSESSMLHPVNEHMSVPSESTVETSVEENIVDQEAEDNIHVSVNSSEGENLDQLAEDKLTVKYSIEKEETIDSSESYAQSRISDSDVYVVESSEKLMSSTPVEENAVPFFFDKPMDEPTFKHVNEVQASNAEDESLQEVQTIQESNMSEVHDLDHDILSNVNSPLSPDFNSNSIQSSSFEAASYHADVETIVEEVDEIKEIDEGLLSELDCVGDFSIPQQESGSNELEKHEYSVGEGSSLELNTILEHGIISEDSRGEIDIHEEDKESNNSDISHRGPVEIDTTLEMPELEARTVEDIDLAFKQIGDKIEKPPALETSHDGLAIEETVDTFSSAINSTHETPILEVRSIEETQETSSQSHNSKPNFLEGTSVPLKHVLDGNTEKQSVEVEGDKAESSVEKIDHKVEESKDLHATKSAKGKGKVSRSSSSSSSSNSSSESSSSDSDKE